MVFAFSQAKPAWAFHPLESKKLDVKIDASAGETFDDNVTFVKSSKKWDLITELAAGLHATYEGRRHLLDLKAGTVEHIFARETSFNNNSQNVDLDYRYLLTDRDTLRLKDKFKNYEDPRSFDEQFGRTNGRYRRILNSADLEYLRQFNEQWAGTLRYGNDINLLSRSDLRDSYTHRAGFDIKYAASTATIYSLVYEFLRQSFERTDSVPSNAASVNSLGLGLKRYVSKRVFFEGIGGIDLISDFASKILLKPRIMGSLNLDLDEKTQLQFLKYEMRSSPSTYQSSIFTNQRISTAVQRQVSERLNMTAGAFYGHGEFESSNVKDNFFGANAVLNYELTKNLKLSLSYTFNLVDSNNVFREYAKNTAMAKVAYVFG